MAGRKGYYSVLSCREGRGGIIWMGVFPKNFENSGEVNMK